MAAFDRPSEPKDYLKDALVFFVLSYAKEYGHDSVRDARLEKAIIAFIRLLKIEGVDLTDLFYGKDDMELAVRNSLSQANMAHAMFCKVHDHDRHYFESSFLENKWVTSLIKEQITPEIREAGMKVIDKTLQVLIFSRTPEEAVADYQEKKLKEQTATI